MVAARGILLNLAEVLEYWRAWAEVRGRRKAKRRKEKSTKMIRKGGEVGETRDCTSGVGQGPQGK